MITWSDELKPQSGEVNLSYRVRTGGDIDVTVPAGADMVDACACLAAFGKVVSSRIETDPDRMVKALFEGVQVIILRETALAWKERMSDEHGNGKEAAE